MKKNLIIGQSVWIMYNNKPTEVRIVVIIHKQRFWNNVQTDEYVYLATPDVFTGSTEINLDMYSHFATKQELINSL